MLRAVFLTACLCLACASSAVPAAEQRVADDCAARFHADLTEIRRIAATRIDAAIVAAREPDKALPGKWMFPPARRVPKQLRDANRLATAAMRSHGRDPWFRGDNATWLTRKLHNDIDRYLDQPLRPGICAPADPMLDFLEEKLAQLEPRMGIVSRVTADALGAARQASLAALSDLAESSTGTLAGEAQADEPSSSAADLAEITAALLAVLDISPPGLPGEDGLGMLLLAHDQITAHPAMRKGSDLRGALLPALQKLEQAAYVARVNAVYAEYHAAFADTLAAIRIANRARCACR